MSESVVNKPAFPCLVPTFDTTGRQVGFSHEQPGISYREWLIGQALCGLMKHPDSVGEKDETVAAWAIQAADAVIAELDKETKK